MNLKKALTKHTIRLSLQGATKGAVIEEMIDLLDGAGKLKDRKSALKAVLDREKKMSTGMQSGIAIPHGKSDSVDSLVAAVGIHKEGVDFDSIDHQPSHIFILTVSPVNRTGPHIQFLAEISRLLHEESVRKELLNAVSEDQVIEILTR
jgi:PTS system nitrogen regulatory IIA component